MANAMMHAIGAQNACPNRQVISLSGDGGFTMMMGEMLTLKQLNLPVKIFVFNNEELSFIAMEMKASGYLDYATDFVNPDFGKLAEAAGIKGVINAILDGRGTELKEMAKTNWMKYKSLY